jgi:hypothetical protein
MARRPGQSFGYAAWPVLLIDGADKLPRNQHYMSCAALRPGIHFRFRSSRRLKATTGEPIPHPSAQSRV